MPDFYPRFTQDGIVDNPYWYDDNIYYQSGYGMPNCTCYALGRWYELQGSSEPFAFARYNDGEDWYNMGIEAGYEHDPVMPRLGANVSWSYEGGGHVGVVEAIAYNSDNTVDYIQTSNSAYQSTFFYIDTLYASNGYIWRDNSTLNGFVYHPNITPHPPTGISPTILGAIFGMKPRKNGGYINYIKRRF